MGEWTAGRALEVFGSRALNVITELLQSRQFIRVTELSLSLTVQALIPRFPSPIPVAIPATRTHDIPQANLSGIPHPEIQTTNNAHHHT